MAASPPTNHIGFTCDECGACPIVGIRYVAKHFYHYDICSDCFQAYDDDQDSFVPFERPSGFAAYRVCNVEPSRGMMGSLTTLQGAAELIAPNDDSVRYMHVSLVWGAPNTRGSKALRDAFTANTNMEILHLHMCEGGLIDFDDQAIADIAAGIGANTGIKRLFWHIREQNRNKITARAIRDMIASNTSLGFLNIGKACREPTSPDKKKTADEFASVVFEGLRHNETLRTLRVFTPENGLSETTKETLLEIVKSNDTIKKIYADFEVSDSRLELLLACNREKWLVRFVETGLTKRRRLDVLSEALQYETTEPVSTAFHLLRAFPDVFR